MSDHKKIAGGRATEAGMGFQASVATWFSAQMLSDMPIGAQFGLPGDIKITSLQCETSDAIDDVVAYLEGGGAIYTQCKTRPSLTSGADSSLAKMLKQLVDLYFKHGLAALTATPNVALLAVAQDAPSSLDILEAACRMFDLGGNWDSVITQVPDDKREALELFKTHVLQASLRHRKSPLTGEDLVALARLFRIRRFDEDTAGTEWRVTSHMLGRCLFGGDQAGEAPMNALLGLSRKLIRTGAPVDRVGLLRALRAEGHIDVSAPSYDKDIEALLAYSDEERRRLSKHTRLPLGEGIPIHRDCLDPLLAAIKGGSLLVTGEPGAGKTGVLLTLVERLAKNPGPLVFLSVERFSGFNKLSDFRTELKLNHDLIEVMAAWPGIEPGVLIIDALDASRGGPSEPVIATLIADAVEKVGARWSIVASIRSFDLRNGQRFRQIMPGTPPNMGFAEADIPNVRHFQVPRLSSAELAEVSAAASKLSELESTAPQQLKNLLRNIFNLSLAAELLNVGVDAQSIRTVSTQSELIQRYEDIRLPTQRLQLAVKAAVALMVRRRQLTVRAVDIENDAVDDVRNAGVLVAAGEGRVAFAHHVLFDHIAGRFYLSWDDTYLLREQLKGDSSIGLLLGPALRFALEQVWRDDSVGRTNTWRFLADLAAVPKPDPVVVSIALRTAAERVEAPTDIDGLCGMIATEKDVRPVARLLSQLARFVGMAVAEQGSVSVSVALAWATVARAAASNADLYLADTARFLLMTLVEKGAFSDERVMPVFGEAARSLLHVAWSLNPENPVLATAGIRFVAKSYGSDPAASRALLERILDDRFDNHASQEAPWLAEGVRSIIPHDPVFVARIYVTLFARNVSDEGKTWIGGSASRILPLTSTHRQDYEHARWQLNKALKPLLDANPVGGTAAVVGAVRGLDTQKHRSLDNLQKATVLDISGRSIQVIDDLLSLQDWREKDTRDEEPLMAFTEYLRHCPRESFRNVVETVLALPSNAAVWARILGVAADRPGMAEDLLWPLVINPHFVTLQGLARDAVMFLAATYGSQSAESRASFEVSVLDEELFLQGREARWWRSILARFLSSVPAEHLITPKMRARQAEMAAAGDLTGNQPFMSMTVGWHSDENIVDSMLQSSGANLERSPDREIRAASRKVEDQVKLSTEGRDVAVLAALWRDILELVDALNSGAVAEPHPELVHSSWGAVCNGVERLAKSTAYNPGVNGLPDLNSLLALIDQLLRSPFPEASGTSSRQMMSWGNWDVRVYAASSLVALAPRFGTERADIVDRMQTCLSDPAPTVRLQVAQALNVLWNVDRDRMWLLVSQVAAHETHEGILSYFIAGPMWPLSRECPERCARILFQIVGRQWARATVEACEGRDQEAESIANLASFLYVARDQPEAWGWIERWTADLRRGVAYVIPMFYGLREVFFFPYKEAPKPDELEMAHRGRHLLNVVLGKAAANLAEARPHLLGEPDEAAVAVWRPLYIAADSLIDQVCDQLYFGSGAFQSQEGNNAEFGLRTTSAKQCFLADYADVLDIIATHAQAKTIHNLFELLAYVVDGDPAGVFDRIAKIVLGPGAEGGYQFESLGMDSLVKLVRRYLADYRDIFEDSDRRQKLVAVLELFSSAGWPDALKLLFELPDLLR